MTLIDLTQDEQMMLLDAMAHRLGDMPREGASAAQMKAFAKRMSAIENPKPVIVHIEVCGGVVEVTAKSYESIVAIVYDHDDEAASPLGTYEPERC